MKKLIAVILSAITVLGCLSGCGRGSNSSGENLAYKDAVNITVFFYGTDSNPKDAAVEKALNDYSAEKIGVTINLKSIPSSEYQNKVNMALATKEDCDLIWANSMVSRLALDGAVMDLSNLLPKYEGLMSVMPKDVWESTKINNAYYFIPNYKETGNGVTVMTPVAMADAVKAKTGIDFKSIEVNSVRDIGKLEQYILACMDIGVKAALPAGMTFTDFLSGDPIYEVLSGAFIVNKKTKKVTTYYDIPEYKEYVALMTKWKEKGIWKEEQVMGGFDSLSILQSGSYALQSSASIPDMESNFGQRYGVPIYAKQIGTGYLTSNSAFGSGWAVAAHTEKAEACLKWLQLLNTDTAFADLFVFGIEGVNYTRDEKGSITLKKDTTWKNDAWKSTNTWILSLQSIESPDKKEQYTKFNESVQKSELLGFSLDKAPIINEMTACWTAFEEYYKMLDRGFYGVDKISEAKEKLKLADSEVCIKEMQRQIDDFFKGKE